jgi:multidrug efflux pump subunit AcrA (membrane-fusion protein)
VRSRVSWPSLRRAAFALVALAGAGAGAGACSGCSGCRGAAGAAASAAGVAPGAPGPALVVRRGELRPRLLLSGELRAARALPLVVPATPSFEVQIRWLAEDGSRVAAGQPVVELDNASILARLEEQRLAVDTAAAELARVKAQAGADEADKEFGVEQARTDLAKARIAAAVPAELLPRRDYQDRQLKLQQAENALGKAVRDLGAQRAKAAADDRQVEVLAGLAAGDQLRLAAVPPTAGERP